MVAIRGLLHWRAVRYLPMGMSSATEILCNAPSLWIPQAVRAVLSAFLRRHCVSLVATLLLLPAGASAEPSDWSVGAYVGRYYDSEPAGALQGRANFLEQYLGALTASKTVWRSASLPLSLEMDGMLGIQSGTAALSEVAVAPALRWSGFPWREHLRTDFRVAPLGLSYTSTVSPLERGRDGNGSHMLNWLFLEVAFSRPAQPADEFFVRLHHRCAVYDLLNNYGANGEDFLALGFRRRF